MDKELWAMVGVVAFIMLALFGGIVVIGRASCLSKYVDFQPEYRGVITGCLVQYNGKTVPAESLRVMD